MKFAIKILYKDHLVYKRSLSAAIAEPNEHRIVTRFSDGSTAHFLLWPGGSI